MVRTTAPQTIDLNMIVAAICTHLGVQLKPVNKPVYKKPYLERIDKIVFLPRGYKILYIATFSGEDRKSTMEHVSGFTLQCGEASQNDYYQL